MSLNERSLRNLEGVHPDLVKVVKLAAEKEPFIVTEGLRKMERQKQLVKAGKSWTLNSRHLTGHAVDLCDPDGKYDIPDMDHIRDAMFAAAAQLKVPLEWGGNWKQQDTPHFQLPVRQYPASGISTGQKVIEAGKKVITSPSVLTTAGGAAGAAASGVAAAVDSLSKVPAPSPTSWAPIQGPPQVVVESVNNAGVWKGTAETVMSFGSFAQAQPYLVAAILTAVAVAFVGPWAARKLGFDV